jgi:hypothetical protein
VSHPAGFNLAAAFSTCLLFVAVSHEIGLPAHWGLPLIAVLVGACSTAATWPASLGVAATGWMFLTGFVINSHGELHIAGAPDVWRLLLMVVVATVSTAASRPGARTGPRVPRIGGRVLDRATGIPG